MPRSYMAARRQVVSPRWLFAFIGRDNKTPCGENFVIANNENTLFFCQDFVVAKRHTGGIHPSFVPAVQNLHDIEALITPPERRWLLRTLIVVSRLHSNMLKLNWIPLPMIASRCRCGAASTAKANHKQNNLHIQSPFQGGQNYKP